MNKILKRATAGLLVIAFGFICIPESLRAIFSDKIQTAKANTAVEREAEIQPDEFAYNSLEKQETYILSENRNMRNRYRKVYNLSDGAVLAEQYSTPVHYFDKAAGKYEEIDNSLIETSDENGTYYKNAANAYGVKIYKNAAQSDSFIEISKDGYKLSFKPVEEKNTLKKFVAGNVQINNTDPISAGLKSEFDYSANKVAETRFVPSSVSEAVYNNFADEASLKYALNSSGISEIITINRSAEQYSYVFGLDGDGLFFEEQDDGAVLAYTPEAVEALRIEAPETVDANGRKGPAARLEVTGTAKDRYLKITADSEWVNAPETVLPVRLQADIKVSFDDGTENTFTETENGTILSMHGISLPPYYFLTAANLKYSYSGSVANSAFEVCTVKDTAQKAASDGLPVKKSTLIAAEKNVVSKTDKVYTQVKELDVGKINGDDIALGFLPVSSDNGVSVYADGANAAVLSLKYVVNVGLNPDAVTEPFESDCVTSYVNVYTQKLTSVIDFMTVNSNVMPIQLQMVYNQTYDTYKNDLCTANKNYILTGFGKNFKLNLEQYCYRYDFDGNGTYDGAVYIDGSGAVHQFKKTVRSDSGGLHYVCDDCNLTCVILDNSRFTIYKNDYPYMYFANNRLQWIATSNKCLRVSYESANGKYRIKKVYNCLEGGTYDYPSSTEAQSVTFSYNSDNLLTSVTSNYGESVSFTYDANQQLTKVSRGSLPLATVSYDSAGKITKVIGKQKTGYSFKYWRDDQVRYVYNVTTNGYVSDTGKVMFNDEGTTKSVYRDTAGLQQIAYSYGFNSSAKCESAYKGYYMYRDERSPRSSITIYSKQESNKVRTNTALSYTEDFTQLNNATFESLTGNSPTGWTVNTANEGSNYTQNSYGYALSLTAGSSASQSYNFKNYYTTSYVLGFYARTPGDGCPLKVTLSGKNVTKTFTIGKYERYYAAIVFDRTVASNSGTLKFENLSSDTIIIDNVSLAPVESYEEAVWNGATATQNNKKITRESTCTSSINSDNQVKEETTLDHLTGATLTKVNTYTSDKLYIDKTVSTLKYKENGVERSETETVECASTPTSTATTTTYKAADGSSLKTYVRTETNIYGMPVKEVGVNKDKTYYFYENTQNNLRPVKKIICNNATEIAAGESHDEHTTDYVETYTYNSYGECSQISDGSNTNTVTDYHSGGETLYGGSGQYWKTDVNGFGDPMAIYENGNSVKQIQYEYNGYRQLSKSIYNRSSADMSYADYRYDQYGNVKTIKWYEKNGADAEAVQSADYSNTYDFANLSQTVVTDGVSYVYQANYNNSALKSKIGISGNGYGASYVYNGRADGLLSSSTYTFNNFSNGVLTRTYTPQYNNKKQIVSETDGSNFKSEYTYDAMGRVIKYSVTNNSAEIGYNTYTYASYSSSGVKYALQNVTSCSGTSTGSGSYGYDALGRVNRITTNRSTEETISYDKYNRLSGTTLNGYSGTWYSYKYDANNNLTEIGKRVPNGPPVTQAYATFTYNSKNQLTSYFVKGGTTKYYSYDNLGNPVKYGVSSTGAADNMVWAQGTKLASGSYKDNSFSYKYNADGVRYEKTVNGITTRQYLEGQRVIAEETINESGAVTHAKYYIYDQTGIAGMVYDGQTYYFLKNIFGDVTTIYDADGQIVASYTYDHWGNITSGGVSGVGYENPFRYRGYYYDNETGFYYLQTRYYDPEICRFISADNLELLPELTQAAGQLNLYAYCNNNPIMYTDPTGEIAITIAILIGMGIGAAVGLGVGIATGKANGASGWEWAGYIISGVASGILAGGVVAASIFTGGSAMSFGYNMLNLGLSALVGGGAVGGTMAVAGAGIMIVGGVIAVSGTVIGANVVFSKSNPGMSNKPPVSWTNINEGIEVYNKFDGNSEKATEYLLNNKYGKGQWGKGAKTEYNALKKWFDRIIRLWRG